MSPIPNQTIAKLFHYQDPSLEKEFAQIYDFLQFSKYPDDSIDGKALKLGSLPENRLRPIISEDLVKHPDPTPEQPGYFVGDTLTIFVTSYAVLDKDRTILADDDAAGSAVTITLPVSVDNEHRAIDIKKIGSTGVVTIAASGAELIDDLNSIDIIFQYDSMRLVCDGAQWWIT